MRKPPPPGEENTASATKVMNRPATQASKALPPSCRISAAARGGQLMTRGDNAFVLAHARGLRRSARCGKSGAPPLAVRLSRDPISDTVRGVARQLITETKMKYASICIAFALIAATCGFPGQATSEPNQAIESAAQLFKAGKFTEAGDIYAQIVAQDPKDYSAILQLGRVALACQPARRRAEMVGSGHRSASRRRRCQGHAGRSILSPRRLPKGGGCAQRRRGRQQQTDHRAISDLECRQAGEFQGPDAL